TGLTSWSSLATPTLATAAEFAIGITAHGPNTGAGGTITGPGAPWTNQTSWFWSGGGTAIAGAQITAATTALTYSGTTSTFDFYTCVVASFLADAAPPNVSPPPWQGGRQWRHRFRRRQQLPPAAAPSAVAAPALPPPLQLPVFPRRSPARARLGRAGVCAAGIASAVVTPLGAPQPTRPPQPATPHVATRAAVGPLGGCAGGVASRTVTPLGALPSPPPRPVITHRLPRRAVT